VVADSKIITAIDPQRALPELMNHELAVLLKGAMGLDVASLGAAAVTRAVQSRMEACGHSDMAQYLEFARGSAEELQQLVETIVVPETWFMRDPQAFVLLAKWAVDSWWPKNPHGPLRLLSLPCSTGEEPYSMAMTLLAAGFPVDRVSIDAVDISAASLAVARHGVYGSNSFRGEDLAYRTAYFEAAGRAWRLGTSVQAQVRFQQGNLFADDLLAGAAGYDAIFCRNVLIYFDRETQDRAVGVLRRLLAPQGLLFVGPSETSLLLSHDFAAQKAPLAFAFQNRNAARVPQTPTVAVAPLMHPRRQPRPPATSSYEPRQAAKSNALPQAAALADAGRFAEATALCEQHVTEVGPSAAAFRLSAMIFASAGNPDAAATNYRSALYLDPDDYESLIHLGLLLEKRGDAAGAKVLQLRARRLETRIKAGTVS
jgi:chemotaxis protein methyltransferase WspC